MNRAPFVRWSALLAVLGCALPAARAEEPPAPPAPPTAPTPPAPPGKAEPPVQPPAAAPGTTAEPPKEPATPEAPTAAKDEPLKPAAAWNAIQKDASDPAKRKPGLIEARAKEYLVHWEAAKQEADPDDLLALGQLYGAAQNPAKATEIHRKGAGLTALSAAQRVLHVQAFAGLTLSGFQQGTLKADALAGPVKEIEGWLDLTSLTSGPGRANLLTTLGFLHKAQGRKDAAIQDWMAAAEAANERAFRMAATIVDTVAADLHTLEAIEPARKKVAPLLAQLSALQASALAAAKAVRDAEQDNAMKPRRDQAFRAAENAMERMKEVDRPLRMLGEPAPEWTLVKAYGKGKRLADYRGKVVLVDFWATWCPWCIKSFPALRDLVRDLGGNGLEVVGVTTSASSVWDQRYNLDDDLKDKAVGASTQPVAKRPTAPSGGDGTTEGGGEAAAEYEKALADYKAKEQDAITAFIANHAMTWDVVQIDEKEPGPKFAVAGWPHAVVIDRAGRVRHLHSGALLKDKAEALAEFRKILTDLLAEPAPK